MKYALYGLCLAIGSANGVSAQAQEPPPIALEVPAIPGERILLPGAATEASDTEQWNRVIGEVWVRNVSHPSLYRVAPKNGDGNGQAVIVVPGGGYSFVSIESEGFRVAERLAAKGYTAFVLKYRPRPTPRDPAEFMRQLLAEWAGYSNESEFDHPPAVADLAAAVELVHERSAEWGLDPGKLGAIGFSAGAQSTVRLLQQYEEAALLENVALIYPPIARDMTMQVRPDLFMAIAADDFLYEWATLDFVGNWQETAGSVEFHLYSGGSHGFGMRPQGTTSDLWIDQYLAWLAIRR